MSIGCVNGAGDGVCDEIIPNIYQVNIKINNQLLNIQGHSQNTRFVFGSSEMLRRFVPTWIYNNQGE